LRCPEWESGTGNMLDVIEYYYREFDSYFVTALADEIVKLDNGTFAGWSRTGYQFKVHALGTPGSLTVCRFFSVAFGLKSAHFYTPVPEECARGKDQSRLDIRGRGVRDSRRSCRWYMCRGTEPIYRLYNDGREVRRTTGTRRLLRSAT
jgi:hypothetical protein